MKILIGKDIREADLRTIENEPVRSIDLMERAAVAAEKLIVSYSEQNSSVASFHGFQDVPEYLIVAGKGNNGGDGLAVARLLSDRFGNSRRISVLSVFPPEELSHDCRINFDRLPAGIERYEMDGDRIVRSSPVPEGRARGLFNQNTVIVDALLGTGVSGAVKEPVRRAVRQINSVSGLCRQVISIDLPSGLPTEPDILISPDVVVSDVTITMEFPKLSLLLPETGRFAGKVAVAKISLDRKFMKSAYSEYCALDRDVIRRLMKPRGEYDNKGTHGHALLIAGCSGMMGAAVLCAGAALRSGCGLVSVRVPAQERKVIHISHPSAIVSPDPAPVFSSLPDNLSRYSSIAVGPGLGQKQDTVAAMKCLLSSMSPDKHKAFARSGAFEPHVKTLVLDADALNIISFHPDMFGLIPSGSVLTPHVGELSRLLRAALSSGFITRDVSSAEETPVFGDFVCDSRNVPASSYYPWRNDMDKIVLVRALSRRLSSVIVVKGAHTMICAPDGKCLFNMTGNPGMAKGGSGDILTGLVAGLAARGYDSLSAAILGVWFHGLAGDKAAAAYGMESMNSSDILEFLRIDLNL